MPDVIDSLKRLERIGSEYSKTVEKIIQAARDLEGSIATQYQQSRLSVINGPEILQRVSALSDRPPSPTNDPAKSLGIDPAKTGRMQFIVQGGVPNDPL
jgi:hypothetical protein